MLAAAPLLALPVVVYNLLVVLFMGGVRSTTANAWLTAPRLALQVTPTAAWPVSASDMLLAASLVILFVELLKSVASRKIAVLNHAFSLLLLMACLAEFLLAPAFATSTFFLVSLMVLLDVLAGFIFTIAAARRQVDLKAED